MRPAKDYTVQHKNINHYRPQTKLREGNVFTPVCHSVQGGVYPSMQWAKWGCVTGVCNQGGVQPPPQPVNKRAVRILLECFLVSLFIQKLRLTCIVGVVYVKLRYRVSYIELENQLYTSLLCQTSHISWNRQHIFLNLARHLKTKKWLQCNLPDKEPQI